MSDFELLPLFGGATVTVPSGETVLGRGPLLGINDKRVSRNHALLENSDGRLRLKSTHVNPVFLQSRADLSPRPLIRDEWTVLQLGDTMSLLPGQLCYRIQGKPNKDQNQDQDQDQNQGLKQGADHEGSESDEESVGTPRNSQAFEETPHSSAPIGPPQTLTLPTQRTNQSQAQEKRLTVEKGPDQSPDQGPDLALSPPRPRMLPAWMMTSVSQSSSSKHRSAGRTQATPSVTSSGRTQATPSVTSSGCTQATPSVTSSGCTQAIPSVTSSSARKAPDSEEEEEQRPKKKKRKMNGSERTSAASAPDMSPTPEPSPSQGQSPDPDPGPVSAPEKTSTTTATSKRPQCPYGKDCYRSEAGLNQDLTRKNPLHFQEQSHPGDQDYEEPVPDSDSEQDSERPECPYGTDCYRKNPLHRKEFKHSKKPVRRTPAAPQRAPDEDDDKDEYESSFIDSESDYEPPAQRSSSESEDLSQLQREASRLVKRRK